MKNTVVWLKILFVSFFSTKADVVASDVPVTKQIEVTSPVDNSIVRQNAVSETIVAVTKSTRVVPRLVFIPHPENPRKILRETRKGELMVWKRVGNNEAEMVEFRRPGHHHVSLRIPTTRLAAAHRLSAA